LNAGRTFHWRGISAFRLAEMIAHGREAEATAYLEWAAKEKLNVVRVFVMARHLFPLSPDDGLRALPRLLELAAARGLFVEIVALADTAEAAPDFEQHVKAVGAIAAAHKNALVEIANEPWHPTQDRRLHDPAYVKTLAGLVPAGVPVALGSAEEDAAYAAGTYATWHSPRGTGEDGWQHVMQLQEGARLLASWQKPVISDEPIGAHAELIAGRRDNAAPRFAAMGALTRLIGLGATFHYEEGLQGRLPTGPALEAFRAWRGGLDLLDELPDGGRFLAGPELESRAAVKNVRGAFGREYDDELWVLVVEPSSAASVVLGSGWKADAPRELPGVRVMRGRR
jgi:hypothetical protein